MKWLARCLVNLYDLSHDGTVVIKIPFSSTPSHSFHGHHLMRLHPSVYYIANRHYKAIMGAYGRVRFVLLCTVYILKIASYDKFVLASTIPPSGKLDLVIFISTIEMKCDLFRCSYHVISISFSCLHYLQSRLSIPT